MSLFNYMDYREYLRNHIEELPQRGRGEISKLAKALGVHQSLVSLILGGDRDLTLEQVYELAHYLSLTELETDYLTLLVQWSRAGTPRSRNALFVKLNKVKAEALQVSKRVSQDKVLSDPERAMMYSSWVYSAIRLYASVGAGKSIEQIQERFGLSRQKVVEVLNFLESAGLVESKSSQYQMLPKRTFLEKGTPHLLKHHTNWRIQSLSQADQLTDSELMFTSPVSLSKKDFEILREKLTVFVNQFLETVAASPAEEVACLNIDFFWIKPR